MTGQIENLQKVGDIWVTPIIRYHAHLKDERADRAMERLLIERFTCFKTGDAAAVTAPQIGLRVAHQAVKPTPAAVEICIASYFPAQK